MGYIPTEPVESSNIEAIGYHQQTQTLRIAFKGRDGLARVYDYPMVPSREYAALMEAESKGKFFNTRIKPMYAYRTPRPEELEASTEVADSCAHERREATVDGSIVVCADCGIDLTGDPAAVVIEGPPSEPTSSATNIEYEVDDSGGYPEWDDLISVPCRCCGKALQVPPEDACDLCAPCYVGKGGDTNNPCQSHPTRRDDCPHGAGGRDCEDSCTCGCHWKPIGEHEHPQLMSEPED